MIVPLKRASPNTRASEACSSICILSFIGGWILQIDLSGIPGYVFDLTILDV